MQRSKLVPGKLLLISDPEGCKGGQSQVLCSDELFSEINAFMKANPDNKVAFLGDYFDHGPLVVNTINNIMNLKYTFDNRVSIILGNRDVNKLRFIYEMQPQQNTVSKDAAHWAVWTKFYDTLTQPLNLHDRFKEILTKSMGASWPPQVDSRLNEYEAAYVLLSVFSPKNASAYLTQNPSAGAVLPAYENFIKNCRALFTMGKIVSYDSDYKTLLSHAGGVDSFLLHNIGYYESILTNLPELPYYNKIEAVRIALQKAPAASEIASSFDDKVYNAPLHIISSLLNDPPAKPDNHYFLLQALGLKPDAGNHFVSFIQSGDVQSCRGPMGSNLKWAGKSPYNAAQYETYLQKLSNSGVKFVASGHSPHCAPLPIIYTKPEVSKSIVFINNDTSNGFRPAEMTDVSHLPLCYVTKTGRAGISSLQGGTEDTYKGPGNVFSPLVGEFTADSAPQFLENPSRIQYSEGKSLIFPARLEETPPKMFAAATMSGGKRRSKKRATKKNRRI